MLSAIQIAALKPLYLADNAFAGGLQKGDVLKLVNRHIPTATNIPAGAVLGKVTANIGEKTEKVTKQALKLHTKLGAGQVLVTLHGESHWKDSWKGQQPQPYMPDRERGNALAAAYVDANENPSLIMLEAGFGTKYNFGGLTSIIVREEDIIGPTVLGIPARSNFIAGFLFLCLIGGNQNAADSALLYLGYEHADILDGLEYFGQHSAGDWYRKRARSYAVIRSLQH